MFVLELHVAQSLDFYVMCCQPLLVLYLLAIVLPFALIYGF